MSKVTNIQAFLKNNPSDNIINDKRKKIEELSRFKLTLKNTELDDIEDICWGPHGMTQSRFLKSVMLYVTDLYGDYSEVSISRNERTHIKYEVMVDKNTGSEIETTRGKHPDFYHGFQFAARELKIEQSKIQFKNKSWFKKHTSWLMGYVEGAQAILASKHSPYMQGALDSYKEQTEALKEEEAKTLEELLYMNGFNAMNKALEQLHS